MGRAEEAASSAILRGLDPYQAAAAALYGTDSPTAEQRRRAKALLYFQIYSPQEVDVENIAVTKKEVLEEAARGEGCLGRAADDEPIFVVRARDINMVRTVQHWMEQADLEGVPLEKIRRAEAVKVSAVFWRKGNVVKIPD